MKLVKTNAHVRAPMLLLALLVQGLMLLVAPAQGQVGMSAVPFLNIEPDARSSALGNTGVTRIGSAHAAHWNPALLGFQQEGWLSLSHSNWLPAFGNRYYHDHLNISNPLSSRHTVAAHVTYLNLGSQTATDDQGNELGEFGNYELAAGLTYGRRLSRSWALGGGLRYIHSNLGAGQFSDGAAIQAGTSLSADLGAFWQGPQWSANRHSGQLRWGLALSHLGPGITYMSDQNRHSLPANFRTGLSYEAWMSGSDTHRLITSFDVNKGLARMEEKISGGDTTYAAMPSLRTLWRAWGPVDVADGNGTSRLHLAEQFSYSFGMEYWFQNMLALRLGYHYEHPLNGDREFLTLGTGLRYGRLGFDFSFLHALKEDHPMANTLRLTAKLAFSPVQASSRPPVRPTPATAPAPPPAPVPPVVVPPPAPVVVPPPAPVVVPPPAPVPARKFEPGFDNPLIRFGTMSSRIEEQYASRLDSIATLIMDTPAERHILVVGHTDSTGNTIINDLLSESRARAVWLELVDRGVSAQRLGMLAAADTQPLASNTNEAGRALNRRSHFTVEHKDDALPIPVIRPEQVSVLAPNFRPVFHNNSLRFYVLELLQPETYHEDLAGVAALLQRRPTIQIYIGSQVSYRQGDRAFMDELEKARSEKLRYLLIRAGADASRVHVVYADSDQWQQHIAPWIEEGNPEQTIVIAIE